MVQLKRSFCRSATVWALKVGIRCCDGLLSLLWPVFHVALLLLASLLPAEAVDCLRATCTFQQAAAALRETFLGPQLSKLRGLEAAEVLCSTNSRYFCEVQCQLTKLFAGQSQVGRGEPKQSGEIPSGDHRCA